MIKCLLLVCLIFVSAAISCDEETHQKLFSFGENEEPVWLPSDSVFAFKSKNIPFVDVTNTHKLPQVEVPTPPALPTQPQQKQTVDSLLPKLEKSNLRSNVETLSSYRTRFYTTETGVAAAEWIHSTLLAYASNRQDISVRFFNVSGSPQPCVIASIQGTESDDIAILGSHLDSIHLGGAGEAPGVDDDGSGSVCVLEVFRVLVQNGFKPNRTIEFHFYAAEEVGLVGSQAVATSYADEGKNVVGMMQLDMTFYVGTNNENLIGIVSDFVSEDLTQFVRELVQAYSLLPWKNTLCDYGCSDHWSWTKQGYRSSFPFESQFEYHNPYIHTEDDTLQYANFDHGLEFAKIGLGFLVELAATIYD